MRNWDLELLMGMMPKLVLGMGECDHWIWEIAGSNRTISATIALLIINTNQVAWHFIHYLWNECQIFYIKLA